MNDPKSDPSECPWGGFVFGDATTGEVIGGDVIPDASALVPQTEGEAAPVPKSE